MIKCQNVFERTIKVWLSNLIDLPSNTRRLSLELRTSLICSRELVEAVVATAAIEITAFVAVSAVREVAIKFKSRGRSSSQFCSKDTVCPIVAFSFTDTDLIFFKQLFRLPSDPLQFEGGGESILIVKLPSSLNGLNEPSAEVNPGDVGWVTISEINDSKGVV